jgi:hypothetical protein
VDEGLMVDILEASGANRPKVGAIATPTSTVSQAELAAPGVEMGQALRGMGQAADRLFDQIDAAGVPAAQAAGLAAVGRDENGQPTVELRPFAITKSDAAFNAAATQGLLSQHQMSTARGLQEIAAQFQTDPAGFDEAAKKFISTVGKGAKEMRPLVAAEGDKLRQQHFLSISNKAVAAQTANALTSITTQIEDTQNTLFALARKGGSDTPEAQEALARISGLYNQLEKNPAFGYPAARVSSEVEKVKSLMIGEGLVGEVDRTYDKRGKAEAQKFLTDNILNNEKLNLSNAQRSSLYSTGMSRLQYLDGETKAAVAAHRTTVSTIVSGLQAKVQVPDAEIDGAIDKAQKLGDAESVLKLNAARSVASLRRAGAGLTEEQEVRLFAGIGGRPAAGTPTAPAAVGAVINDAANRYGVSPTYAMKMAHIESRFDPNAMHPGSKATGLFQFIPSTWRQYGQGQDARDPAANADAAMRFTLANQNQLRAALGRNPTDGELYLAHQQGAGGATSLLNNPSARAVDIVGERAVLGNGGTVNMTAGQFAQLWIRKFDGASATPPAGQARGGTATASPFTPEQLRANPFLGSEWIKSQVADQKETIQTASRVADAISSGIDKGVLPNAETFAAFLQMAEQFPDQLGKTRDDLIAKARGYDDALTALGEPSAAGNAMVADAQMKAQGAPILVQQRAAAMKASYDRGVKALEDTPWTEAARRGWSAGPLPPLDFSSGQALAQGLAARSEVATSISARTGQPQSVLAKDDIAAVQGVFRNGSPEQRAVVAAELARMPAEQFEQVIADKEMKDSLIGMSRSGDPSKMGTAFSVLDRAQRTNPDLFHQVYGRDIENRLAAWTSRQSYLSPEELAKEMAKENDPATRKARDLMREDALKKVEKLTPGDIAGYFDQSWAPLSAPEAPIQTERGEALRFADEYRREYAEAFAAVGGDEAEAKDLAVQRVGRVWGESVISGGRMMKFPPEKSPAYPTINGSHDWLNKQLQADVRAALKMPEFDPVEYGTGGPPLAPDATEAQRKAHALLQAPRALIADSRTEAEFQAGKPPSYPVVVKAPNGMFVPLEDAQGRPLRFVGDPDAAMAPVRVGAEAELRARQASETARQRVEADAQVQRDNRKRRRQEQQ